MTTIVTLYPTSQYVGTLQAGWLLGVETPSIFGSVSDGSDATYTQIDAMTVDGVNDDRSGLLSCDFVFDQAGLAPTFFYMQMRARNPEPFATDHNAITLHTLYLRSDDTASVPFDNWQVGVAGPSLGGLSVGLVPNPTWHNFAYTTSSAPVDTANPSADTWFTLDPASGIGGQALAALTTTGLRFATFVQVVSNLEPRKAYLDIYEVRLVVACEPIRRRLAHQRGMQRGSDGQGVTGGKRGMQKTSRQASLRGGSFL